MIFWFIGQPGSGKTTLAQELKKEAVRGGQPTIHIDGDDLRTIFKSGYAPDVLTEDYRKDQTRALQRFVAYLADQGVAIIVSTVNGYRDVREEFKQSRTDLIEVYVSKSDDRGREGFNIPTYEIPEKDFIHLDTTGKTVTETLLEFYGKLFQLILPK